MGKPERENSRSIATLLFYPKDLYQVLTVNDIGQKSPNAFGNGRVKVTVSKLPRAILCLTRPTHRRNYLAEPNLLWFYPILTGPGEGKQPIPAGLSLPHGGRETPSSSPLSHPGPAEAGRQSEKHR